VSLTPEKMTLAALDQQLRSRGVAYTGGNCPKNADCFSWYDDIVTAEFFHPRFNPATSEPVALEIKLPKAYQNNTDEKHKLFGNLCLANACLGDDIDDLSAFWRKCRELSALQGSCSISTKWAGNVVAEVDTSKTHMDKGHLVYYKKYLIFASMVNTLDYKHDVRYNSWSAQ